MSLVCYSTCGACVVRHFAEIKVCAVCPVHSTSIVLMSYGQVPTHDGRSYAATTPSTTAWMTTQAILAVRLPPLILVVRSQSQELCGAIELLVVADRPLETWGDERVLELGQAQWSAMQTGTWDSSLSKQAQLDLERQQSSGTLTPGQDRKSVV